MFVDFLGFFRRKFVEPISDFDFESKLGQSVFGMSVNVFEDILHKEKFISSACKHTGNFFSTSPSYCDIVRTIEEFRNVWHNDN
jgi:hypothetical protein